MKTLAIETSGKTLGLALAHDGEIVAEFFGEAGHTHSERLLPELEKILKKARWQLGDIDKIAVSIGPGSFTGIRIGLVCARVLAQELKVPLVGIDTLKLVPVIDALRGEVYVRGAKGIEIQPAEKYFKGLTPQFANPRAGTLALLAEKLKGEKYDKVLPVYIRKSWAEENKNKNRRDAKSCVSTR